MMQISAGEMTGADRTAGQICSVLPSKMKTSFADVRQGTNGEDDRK